MDSADFIFLWLTNLSYWNIFFFFLLCLCTINSNAQTKLDSLLHVLSNHKKEDNKKINLLNDIAKEYQDKDISQGLQTADIAIALAEKLDDQG